MAKFDLYPAPNGGGYLLDVQSDLLDVLNTRVVVPLIPVELAPRPARRLNPVFVLDETAHVMVTQFLSAVPASLLKIPTGHLRGNHSDITMAIDMLFQGF